jgi:hypothetical protein
VGTSPDAFASGVFAHPTALLLRTVAPKRAAARAGSEGRNFLLNYPYFAVTAKG